MVDFWTEEGRTKLLCKCQCGNYVTIRAEDFNRRKSCGCIRRKSRVGEKYGKLTITKMLYSYNNTGETFVEANCDCGTQGFIVRLRNLLAGTTQSCGCIKCPELSGKRFGRLTVIQQIPSDTHQRRWLCKCDCGTYVEINSYALTSGHTKSCGCIKSEKTSTREEMISNYLKQKGIEFSREKTFQDCTGALGKLLRFDFYIKDINAVIEYDGIQHFYPIDYFGGQSHFKIQKENDDLKDRYCKKHNIPILRIPYTLSDDEIKFKISTFYAQESRNDHSPEGNDRAYAGSGGKPLMVWSELQI